MTQQLRRLRGDSAMIISILSANPIIRVSVRRRAYPQNIGELFLYNRKLAAMRVVTGGLDAL
jgi:hypothetical protein